MSVLRRAALPARLGQVLAVLGLCWVSQVSAQSAGNKAAAEALFEEGRTLMQQQNYAAACVKLEGSQEQDPGLGTMMLLSDCYEKVGKTASAWASFKDAAAAARARGDSDREAVARARADALEPNLSKAVVHGAESTMSLEGLEVVMNGTPVPPAQFGTSVPVDPGKLTVEVSAPGYESWRFEADVPEGSGETRIDIPTLVPAPDQQTAPPPAQPSASGPSQSTDSAPRAVPEESSGKTPLQTTGIVLGVGGIVGLGVGTAFGLRAMSKNDESDDHCPAANQCFARGIALRSEARDAATVSTITFGLGGALLAAGAVLYLWPVDADSSASAYLLPEVAASGAALNVGGAW